MSKYINAEDLKSKITELSEDDYCTPLNEYVDGLRQRTDAILEIVDEMPSADVAEVVRCKDCIYQGNYICKLINRNDSDDFYCADGERKETDDRPNQTND